MKRAGGSIVYSTVVLGLGFLTMMTNELLAIRDMGLVAAVTLVVALAADVLLAPALYLLIVKKRGSGKEKVLTIPLQSITPLNSPPGSSL